MYIKNRILNNFFSLGLAAFVCASIIMTAMPINANAETETRELNNIVIINNDTGETYTIDSDSADSHVVVNEDGSIDKTIIADITIPQPKTRNSVTDAGQTVRVTVDVSYQSSGSMYKMTSVTGSFTVLDSSFSISNRMVKIGNYDNSDWSRVYTYYPGGSFAYYFNYWVDSAYVPCIVGAYVQCTMSRGGSSWSVRCNNFPVYNDAGFGFF